MFVKDIRVEQIRVARPTQHPSQGAEDSLLRAKPSVAEVGDRHVGSAVKVRTPASAAWPQHLRGVEQPARVAGRAIPR